MASGTEYKKITGIPLSFFSPALYRDVGRNWKGSGFSYLFILLFICWIPVVYFTASHAKTMLTGFTETLKSMPAVKITQGQLSLEQNTPFVILDPNSSELLLAVDPDERFHSYANNDALILVTKDSVHIKKLNYQYNYPQDLELDLRQSSSDVSNLLDLNQGYLMASYYLVALFISLVYRYIQVFFYAILGKAFFSSKTSLSFGAVMRIAAVALTPAIVLFTVQSIVGFYIPWGRLVYFLLAMAYLFFGIRVNRITESKEETKPVE